uniref:uncharacterized protein LOC100187336 isoform X2 n=1 Tax=Ciona intestinalis TaxID=7719 RepID=UPI00006A4F8F|nr:uncharacterized protein LOC100187336 isoform X2 [Ciona intestinalis]|eukprot:XP_018667310.1 uncharacterized protein LOC100187336 isoform X2 [Ciona intestinalis]
MQSNTTSMPLNTLNKQPITPIMKSKTQSMQSNTPFNTTGLPFSIQSMSPNYLKNHLGVPNMQPYTPSMQSTESNTQSLPFISNFQTNITGMSSNTQSMPFGRPNIQSNTPARMLYTENSTLNMQSSTNRRARRENFTRAEEDTLYRIINCPYRQFKDVLAIKRNDSITAALKLNNWQLITKLFNYATTGKARSVENLKRKWRNMAARKMKNYDEGSECNTTAQSMCEQVLPQTASSVTSTFVPVSVPVSTVHLEESLGPPKLIDEDDLHPLKIHEVPDVNNFESVKEKSQLKKEKGFKEVCVSEAILTSVNGLLESTEKADDTTDSQQEQSLTSLESVQEEKATSAQNSAVESNQEEIEISESTSVQQWSEYESEEGLHTNIWKMEDYDKAYNRKQEELLMAKREKEIATLELERQKYEAEIKTLKMKCEAIDVMHEIDLQKHEHEIALLRLRKKADGEMYARQQQTYQDRQKSLENIRTRAEERDMQTRKIEVGQYQSQFRRIEQNGLYNIRIVGDQH